ncbi:Uncharacterised protein [Mycobacteroides abscessus subsp. abscessus]|nr:Uncharacterised protein [Mycobacteroides abscessus subsp. abscessus]
MRVRTVSPEVAFSRACCTTESPPAVTVPRSYSAAVSQIEPVHTPEAPSASAAAACRPLPIPPAANTGALPSSASTISGHNTMDATSPV